MMGVFGIGVPAWDRLRSLLVQRPDPKLEVSSASRKDSSEMPRIDFVLRRGVVDSECPSSGPDDSAAGKDELVDAMLSRSSKFKLAYFLRLPTRDSSGLGEGKPMQGVALRLGMIEASGSTTSSRGGEVA